MIREVRREEEGAAHGECRCSSMRVWGWWMLTMNSHGVEISITGCVEEMVRDPNPMFSILFFFFLFSFLSFVHCFYVQEASCSASYGKNKTYKSKQTTKETIFPSPLRLLKIVGPKTVCPSFPTETKYKEITTLKLLLIYAFFAAKDM